MALTTAQVDEAIEQMISHCKLMEEQDNWEPISARGTLRTLGYVDSEVSKDVTQVLRVIAARGFNYCLDPMIPHKTDGSLPPGYACYWGPDQLRSRLEFIR